MNRRKEGDLVKACLLYLHARGIFAFRNNSGAWKVGDRFIRFGAVGSGDILGCLPGGRFLSVECKVGTNKPTEAQSEWIDQVLKHGGFACCVWELEGLEFLLNQAGVK